MSWAVNSCWPCLYLWNRPILYIMMPLDHAPHLTLKKTFPVCVLTALALLWLIRDLTETFVPLIAHLYWSQHNFLPHLSGDTFWVFHVMDEERMRHDVWQDAAWQLWLVVTLGSVTAGRQRAHLCCVSMASSSFALLWLARHKEHRQVEVTTAPTTCQAWMEEEKGNYGPVCTVWMRRGALWKEASTEINVSNLHKYFIQPAFC